MEIVLLAVGTNDLAEFKEEMQRAFQKGYENTYGETEQVVLPEQDIDSSLDTEGAVAYKAVIGIEMVGGAVVVIDNKTQHNHLDLLFVKCGVQNRGIGAKIWSAIKKLHPETRVWETCTPCFEKRNVHFYVNVCGFHIVQHFTLQNPLPGKPEDFIGDGHEGMFKLRRQMY